MYIGILKLFNQFFGSEMSWISSQLYMESCTFLPLFCFILSLVILDQFFYSVFELCSWLVQFSAIYIFFYRPLRNVYTFSVSFLYQNV
jgi:hypothetical protein